MTKAKNHLENARNHFRKIEPPLNILDGAGGDDRLVGGTGKDTIRGGAGEDTLLGDEGGLGGADLMDGGDGNDEFNGNSGDDTLRGDGGADTLNGGAGNDQLTGGSGADLFVFAPGVTTVTDFDPDAGDKIDISCPHDSFATEAFAYGASVNVGKNVHITSNGNTMILLDIQIGSFNQNAFDL